MPAMAPPRIVLFGRGGQVATELEPLLSVLGELRVLGPEDCDFNNPAQVAGTVTALRPNIVVNAAAYTAVDKAEDELTLATNVNAHAVGAMAQAARACGALVVHYSTDYVFDGTATQPYKESAPCNPQSAYGRTKRQGEALLQESGAAHMIFRTAWVYSAVGKNFLKTILRLATERDELRIVADQIGSPTHAATIAAGTAFALQRWLMTPTSERPSLQGIFHLVSTGSCSWHDFASLIVEEARTRLNTAFPGALAPGNAPAAAASIRCTKVTPIATTDYPTPAKRPGYSVLDTTHFTSSFGLVLPPWQAMVGAAVVGLIEGLPAQAVAAGPRL